MGFPLPRELYTFDEEAPLGICPTCERKYAVLVVEVDGEERLLPESLRRGTEGSD